MVDLRPAEADHRAILLGDEETFGIEPRLCHAIGEIFHLPATLIRVVSEDAIIERKPWLIIDAGNKGLNIDINQRKFDLTESQVKFEDRAHGKLNPF